MANKAKLYLGVGLAVTFSGNQVFAETLPLEAEGENNLEIRVSASIDGDDQWVRTELNSEEVANGLSQELSVVEPQENDIETTEGGVPKPRPLTGEKTLACIGISYTKSSINDYVTAAICKKLATRVAEFYIRNSRGILKLKPIGYHMEFDGSPWRDFGKAEQAAKSAFKADYYIIPSIFRKGGNHAGGGIAHLTQLTGWVATHEVGHLLGFGHTGRYTYSKTGKPRLLPYGDSESVMSHTGSKFLTPPQYYHRGWIPKDEVAIFNGTSNEFELKQISNFKGEGNSIVVIPPSVMRESGEGRPAFVAYSSKCEKPCATLYLANGGGSQNVGMTYREFTDNKFTDLHIKVLGSNQGRVRILIEKVNESLSSQNTPVVE